MSDIEDLFTDLNADPEACAPGYESRRTAITKLAPSGGERARKCSAYQRASMPNRDIGGIRKFSWETE